MSMKLGLVGIGKIARDQHIPAISAGADFELAATASRRASVSGTESFAALEDLLEHRTDISAISLATPPHVRYCDARRAIEAGRHVMLEKPPGATLSEVAALAEAASGRGVTLYASWHSREAAAVAAARDWLADKVIERVEVEWKEDVRHWHPGQDWVWAAGALGVFDPGINALSILTLIFPRAIHVSSAELFFPANRDTPIAATLDFHDPGGAMIGAAFDWRQEGPPVWDIRLHTTTGTARLSAGGARLSVDGEEVSCGQNGEYARLYSRFAALIAAGESDVDLAPMRHVADAFTLGRRIVVDPFHW